MFIDKLRIIDNKYDTKLLPVCSLCDQVLASLKDL